MLLKLSKFCLYTTLFSVVLVVVGTFFPYIGVKYFFFRATVSLSLIFFVLWWAFEAAPGEVRGSFKKISRHPLFIAVSAFALFYLLASLFAYDSHAAFWSNFERGEGGFQMIHYYLFFLLLSFTFKEKKEWQRLFRFSLLAAGFMILYGVLGQLGTSGFIDANGPNPPTDVFSKIFIPRFQGSLGNPAYVAPYLMFIIFFCAYLWITSENKNHRLKLFLYGVPVAFFLFFFYLSKTRGALIGLVIATLVFFLYLLLSSKGKVRKWSFLGISFFALFAGLIMFVSFYLSPHCAKSKCSNFAKNLSSNRLLDLSPGEQSFKTRTWTWNSAWQGFKERPVFGWGPENFSAVFDRYFDPRHYIPGANSETWFDRAHSVFFDYLAETGFLGLVSYISIFVVFFWQLFKNKKAALAHQFREKEKENLYHNPLLFGLLLALPIGYLIQGLALFDVLPIYLNLFLFLAFSLYQFDQKT